MRYELENRSLQANFVKCGKSEQHDSHMAYRGVSEHQLELFLPECEHRSVQNINDAKRRKHDRPIPGLLRKEHDAESQQTVCPHLKQDAGMDHDDRRRRLRMYLQHPGVERKDWQLD